MCVQGKNRIESNHSNQSPEYLQVFYPNRPIGWALTKPKLGFGFDSTEHQYKFKKKDKNEKK